MSWRHSKAAGEVRLDRAPPKAVLLALAHHADEYAGTCYPSIARLVLFTGLSERSVQNALSELVTLGLIERTIGGNRRASVYTLTLEAAPALAQGQAHPAGAAPPPRRTCTPPPQELHPNYHKNNHKKDAPAKSAVTVDWKPSPQAIEQASKEYPYVDIAAETRLFIDYNIARGTEFSSIGAAWRTWLGRAKPTRPGQRGKPDNEGALDHLRSRGSQAGERHALPRI